jgi:hypothetical protein
MTFSPGRRATDVQDALGLISDLQGHWVGTGFNLIAVPTHFRPGFRLELNATYETFDVRPVAGDIPNRGHDVDIILAAVRYLQQVTDTNAGAGIHIENGLWLRVPPTLQPPVSNETYVRHASIPHGVSLLAQSTSATTAQGPPQINPVDSTPFTGAIHALNGVPATPVDNASGYLRQYSPAALPNGVPTGHSPADTVKDPTVVLDQQIAGQTITQTVTLETTTDVVGSVADIPFLVSNANAVRMDAVHWIEHVDDGGAGFLQLQVVQRVILDFFDIHWPHISVSTLRKV